MRKSISSIRTDIYHKKIQKKSAFEFSPFKNRTEHVRTNSGKRKLESSDDNSRKSSNKTATK
jgi:hypothetical protein